MAEVQFTLNGLSDISDVPDYMVDGFWYVSFTNESSNPRSRNYFERLDKYVQDISIPQLELDYDKTDYGLITLKQRKVQEEITITFCDDINGSVVKFFTEWIQSLFNESQFTFDVNWRNKCKDLDVKLMQFRNGVVVPFIAYSIINCYPIGLKELSLSFDSGDKKEFSVDLEFERCTPYTWGGV